MNLIDLICVIGMKNNIVLNISKDYIRYRKTFKSCVDCYDYIKIEKLENLKVMNIDIIICDISNYAFVIECR